MLPKGCGNSMPLAPPSLAVLSAALFAGNVPVLRTVIVACTLVGPVRIKDEVTTSLVTPHGVDPAVKVKDTVPALLGPSCSSRVAVTVWPGVKLGSAVNEKSAPVVAPAAIEPKLCGPEG
jgi:hypothetical protein